MPNHRTELIKNQCPVCEVEFNVCPPGKTSRLCRARYEQVFCSNECSAKARFRTGSDCNNLSPTDAAYIAGFLDGEGSIMVFKHRNAYALRVSFANNKLNVLEWIRDRAGVGNITKKERASSKHATSYALLINGQAAKTLLDQISGYLVVKKEQSEIGISFFDNLRIPHLKADREWQRDISDKLKCLNRRGSD